MAYDRDDYRRPSGRDTFYGRDGNRDDFRMNRDRDWDRGSTQHDRGFFERAGDEIASWFGDDDAERRRNADHRYDDRHERTAYPRAFGNRQPSHGSNRDFRDVRDDRDIRDYRSPSASRDHDPHYRNWRQQQIDALDRDYDEYRRENQSRFESDFGGWRDRRMSKRTLLGQAKEHMEVVGNDDNHVGTIDRIAGDRIILAKSDPEAGGVHHSISCADVDRIEDGRVILECSADEAQHRWRDDNRSRALFEREDQGEAGPHILDRSFEGTYRR